ncbi:hypothetical protein IDZ49_09530 [Francisella tularensis]|nr:hypothetical protein [Francisella tularensis]
MKTIMQQEASSIYAKVANQLNLNKDITTSLVNLLKDNNINRIITIAIGSSDYISHITQSLF